MTNLDIWVIYDSPSDFPGFFVARKSDIKTGLMTDDYVAADTFDEVCAIVKRRMRYEPIFMQRHPSDEPQIVGCLL